MTRFVLGWLWYSPFLFGKSWMALTHYDPKEMKRRMPVLAPADLICNFMRAFVLVHAVHYASTSGAAQGAAVGFFDWLGFVAVVMLMMTLYEKRPG